MRIASFNVENLFSRAKVLNFANNDIGTDLLKKIGELKELLKANTYTNKTQIFNKYQGLKEFIEITEDRGKLFKKSGSAIVGIKANGVNDWDGTIQFKRDKFDQLTRTNTAKTMKEVKADIFCMVEVENRETLSFFNSEMLGTGKFPFNMCIDGNDSRGIDVGLLSRYKIKNIRTHIFDKKAANAKPIFPRDCLEVELEISNTQSLHILCNHLTSRLSDKTGDKRKVQTTEIKSILQNNYDLKKDLVAVAGDFNDSPDKAALSPLLNMQNLFDVLALQFGNDKTKRWTYNYQNKQEQIDFLLVSKPLKDVFVKAGVERKGMFGVAGLPGMTETPFPSVTTAANAASDHGAVWADFNI
jgi:endonuclease/exonuclease/phosphatase family metal-dependent hydrolase